MIGLKQVIFPAAAGTALASAPVAPAHAVVPLIAFLGHLMVAHHAVGMAVRATRAPFVAASTAAYIAGQSAAAYAPMAYAPAAYGPAAYGPAAYGPAAYAPAAYQPPAPYYYGYSSARSWYPYATAPAAYAYSHYPRMPSYPARPVYYGASQGYYRSQVSYFRSVPRAYGPARSYQAPRANYRTSYAFASAARRGGGLGYRR